MPHWLGEKGEIVYRVSHVCECVCVCMHECAQVYVRECARMRVCVRIRESVSVCVASGVMKYYGKGRGCEDHISSAQQDPLSIPL